MGSFEPKQNMHLSLNKEARERMKEIQDHLQENYNGMAHFVRQKLHEEQALSIEERIRKKEKQLEEEQEQLEKLKRIQSERDQQDKIRDKRELLKEKQKKLREVQESGLKSEADLLRYEALARVNRGYSIENSEIQEHVRRAVDSKLESRPEVDELVETVQRLQRQIAELNGGEEDYFMDLGKLEVEH